MATVLVTCVGSGVGQSIIDSLNLKGGYKIIGCDGNRNVYAHSFCNKFIVVPSLYSEGYVQYILNLCIEYKVDVLIPGHDHELLLFAKNQQLFNDNGIEVLVSEPTIIEVSRDKKMWYDYFSKRGCKIVPTFFVSDFKKNIDESIFPAIVKPCGGSASQGISIINKSEELESLNDEDIIQPYLFPEKADENYEKIVTMVAKGTFIQMSEISIQLIFDKSSKYRGIYISKNVLKNGVPVFVEPIEPNKFRYIEDILRFVPILERKGVKGPVNIQGRVTEEGIYFFEMNMRFTGITGNRSLFGFNEVAFLVDNFLDNSSAELGTYTINKLGVRQVACTTISVPNVRCEDKIITVLGGGSHIGKYFVESIAHKTKKINLIVREPSFVKYKKTFGNFENVNLISSTSPYLTNILAKSDVFINFVSALAFEDETKQYDAIRYVYSFVTKIAMAKIPLILNISSQSVYDQKLNEIKNESHQVVANNSYAFQKLILEEFFDSIKKVSVNSKVINLRLPRVLNTRELSQLGFFGVIISNYLSGIETYVSNPNDNTNLIAIEDVGSAMEFLISEANDFSGVLNVSGENITMEQYANLVSSLLPDKKNVIKLGDSKEVKNSSMLSSNLLEGMGWKYKTSVKDMVLNVIKNYIKREK